MHSQRHRRRDRRPSNDVHDIDVSSYIETEDYSKNPNELLKRRRTFPDVGIRRTANEDDSEVETSDVRPTTSRRGRNSVREKIAYDSRESIGISRTKSTASAESMEKRKRRRRSRLRSREDGSEKSVENSDDFAFRSSGKHRRSSASKISDNDVIDRSREKKNRHHESSDRNELPITEILKKAQENSRTKYEEPIALPELTTDTIYVQGRNGFSALKIPKERGGSRKEFEVPEECDSRPIKVAIITQKTWKCTGFIYQGLLGGMAFMHFILMQTFFVDSLKFISNYCMLSEIYTNVFSFLIAMCIIAVFDKFDVAHLDIEHLREIYANHAKSAIAILLYVISFCLHQVTLRVNDKLSLIYYKSANSSVDEVSRNDTYFTTLMDELPAWQRITLSKDILVVLAWIFVSLGTRDDMLLSNLEAMAKSAEDSNLSA